MSNARTILLRNATKKMRHLLFYLVCIWSKWRIQNLLFRSYSSVKIHLYSSGSAANRCKEESRESTTLLHQGLSFLLITLGSCIAIVFIFISKKKNPSIFWGWGGQLDCIQTITMHRSITVAICCRRKEIAVFCSWAASEVIDWWGWGMLTMEASRLILHESFARHLPSHQRLNLAPLHEKRLRGGEFDVEKDYDLSDNITWLRIMITWRITTLRRILNLHKFCECVKDHTLSRLLLCEGF